LTLIVSIALAYFLNNRVHLGQEYLPALGKLLNPYTGIWQNARSSNKLEDLQISHPSLNGEVEVVFDKRLVPHIFASDMHDLLFAQGYVEAYLRLWQLDISWRNGAGQVAEVAGVKAAKLDLRMRKLGLNKAAQTAADAWEKLKSEDSVADAYVDGINHFIENNSDQLPIEFKIINYKPTKWNWFKSACIQKSMGLVLASMADDLSNTNAIAHFCKENFDYLYPEHDQLQSPIIPAGTSYPFEAKKRATPANVHHEGLLQDLTVVKSPKGIGSNNWAVGSSKTKSGFPILANDPHLDLTLPSIWYEVHLNAPGINAYGVSFAGVPGILIGFNEQIAWGVTNVGHDVRDYYTIDWTDDKKTKYQVDGKELIAEQRKEVVKVAGGIDQEIIIKETVFGPIYYDSEIENQPDLAIQWLITAKPTSPELNTCVDVISASNYEEFKTATAQFDIPAQNFVYADRTGKIALRINGKLPVKYDQEGRFVKKGNSITHKWTEYIPRAQNPQNEAPAKDIIGSANQVSAATDYPYYYTGAFEDFRGRRLYQELERRNNMDVSDMKALQLDNHSLRAKQLLPILLQHLDKSQFTDQQTEIYTEVSNWDYNYDMGQKAPSYFDAWFRVFESLYWDEMDNDFTLYRPEGWRCIEIYQNSDDPFADIVKTEKKEDISDLTQQSFEHMAGLFAEIEDHNWEAQGNFNIRHLANIPGFGSGPIDIGGSPDALNAIRKKGVGPSWRMIVDLENPTKALGVYPGGQSGDPASAYYSDAIETWRTGEYYELELYKSPDAMSNNKLFTMHMQQ